MKKLLTWLGENTFLSILYTGAAISCIGLAHSLITMPRQSTTDRALAYIEQCQSDIAKLGKATNPDFITTLTNGDN